MTNEELVKRYQSGDPEAAGQLWDQISRLASYLVNRWKLYAEEPDLLQEAFLALLDAADAYDPKRGASFSGYYSTRLQWHWARYVARSGGGAHIPEPLFWKTLKYKKFISDYKKQTGSLPDLRAVARGMKITVKEAADLRDLAKQLRVQSLSEPIGGEDDDILLEDALADSTDPFLPVLDQLQNEQIGAELQAIVADLPEIEAECVRLKYLNGLTIAEAAAQIGQTEATVKGRCASGLRRLRKERYFKRIRAVIKDDDRFSMGLRGTSVISFSRYGSSTEHAALEIIEKEYRIYDVENQEFSADYTQQEKTDEPDQHVAGGC